MNCGLPGSSVHGILQAKILEWDAIPFSRGIFPTWGSNSHLLHWQADSSSSQPQGKLYTKLYTTSLVPLMVKNLPANARDTRDADSIPGSGRSPQGGHGNPLQYSCLGNPMERGAWQPTVHGGHRVGHD